MRIASLQLHFGWMEKRVLLFAADFGFQRWVRQSTKNPRPLHVYVSKALEAVKSRRWR